MLCCGLYSWDILPARAEWPPRACKTRSAALEDQDAGSLLGSSARWRAFSARPCRYGQDGNPGFMHPRSLRSAFACWFVAHQTWPLDFWSFPRPGWPLEELWNCRACHWLESDGFCPRERLRWPLRILQPASDGALLQAVCFLFPHQCVPSCSSPVFAIPLHEINACFL